MEKTENDWVKVKTKWRYPTKAIQRGGSKKHDEKKRHNELEKKNSDSKSTEPLNLFNPMNPFIS
jgi:hypothetical protein